jgi:hypothetical protein
LFRQKSSLFAGEIAIELVGKDAEVAVRPAKRFDAKRQPLSLDDATDRLRSKPKIAGAVGNVDCILAGALDGTTGSKLSPSADAANASDEGQRRQ